MTLTQTLLRSPLAKALATPHGVDRYLELIHPMSVVSEVRARIVDITRETKAGEPVATVTLEPTSSWTGHEAGQYVQVGIEVDGRRRTRCFTVSSPESKPGDLITLTMRANPDGVVSKHLVNDARRGDVVYLSPARGEFTLPNPLPRELLLISGGSGITPVMSILRTLLRRGYGGTVHFVHYAQSPDHQIYAEELADLPPNIHVRLLYPECGDPAYTTDELAGMVANYADLDTWACGPAGLIELVQDTFADNPRLRVEYFKTSTKPRGDVEAEGTTQLRRQRRGVGQLRADPAGAGRGARAAPGVRLPDGHLLLLHLAQDRGHGAQRDDRQGVVRARRGHPDLRQRRRRRLLRRGLTRFRW